MYRLVFILSCILVACTPAPPAEQADQHVGEITYVERVENAHNKADFLTHEVVSFDILLHFGGRKRLDGRLHLATNSSAARLDLENRTIWVKNDEVYSSDQPESPAGVRFAAYTWSYFFMLPYKLSDPGTHWEEFDGGMLDNQYFRTQKLSFDSGIGDAPDDWYITFADSHTMLLYAAPYIVTGGNGDVEEAEKDPHSIRYEAYREVDGIPLAHEWTFWEWREGEGHTRQLGDASLSRFEFSSSGEDLFAVPDSATFISASVLDI